MESKARGKEQFHKNQQEKIKELEGQLELKAALHSQSEKQVLHISERLKGKDDTLTCLEQKVAFNSRYFSPLFLQLVEKCSNQFLGSTEGKRAREQA